MGMEEHGRNEEEKKDLAGVDLSAGEKGLDVKREKIISQFAEEIGWQEERILSILKTISEMNVVVGLAKYVFKDKGHDVRLHLHENREWTLHVDDVLATSEKSAWLKAKYLRIIDLHKELTDLTKDSPDYIESTIEELSLP